MIRIFPLPEAVRHDAAVEAWFDERPDKLGKIARQWFEAMRGCGEDVCETLHDGMPTVCVGEAAFGYVNAFTSHVNVGFFGGSDLDNPHGLLEGSGKFMRHVKIRPGAEPDAIALSKLIETAYRDMRSLLKST